MIIIVCGCLYNAFDGLSTPLLGVVAGDKDADEGFNHWIEENISFGSSLVTASLS
jgi:hypothetical protein